MLAVNGGKPLRERPFPGWPVADEADRDEIVRAVRSDDWDGEEARRRFEAKFAGDCGAKHCFAVANGTVSLELILRAMGIRCGDEVILPPYTFIATLSSIVFAGATPVFADIDPDTCNLYPDTLEEKITSRTKAVIAVAVGGCPPDLDALTDICERRGVKLIIDAAQAVGAEWLGRRICTYGDAASVSCQNTKNLTCGEGGIIATRDDALAGRIGLLLNGGEENGRIVAAAEDHRLGGFQAAVLMSQYAKLQADMYRRERNAAYLAGRLKGMPFVKAAGYDERITRHAYHLFLMRLDCAALAERGLDKSSFLKAVNAEGIPLSGGYAPLYLFPCCASGMVESMTGAKVDVSQLPNCERAAREFAWTYQGCLTGTFADMDDIADAMLKVWDNAGECGVQA